jgi:hypothetical protein
MTADRGRRTRRSGLFRRFIPARRASRVEPIDARARRETRHITSTP